MSHSNESLRERLKRLRRTDADKDASVAGADAGRVKQPLPAWARKRMTRASPSHGSVSQVPRTVGMPVDLKAGPEVLGTPSKFFYRETILPADHAHGAMRLTPNGATDADSFVLLTEDPTLRSLALDNVVFLDTETTGLSGGAGVFVFMVGLARYLEGRWHVWQGFLRGPEEEPVMLAEAARRIADSGGVVSFFGKSFDRHRLEDKMRIHGIDPPFDGLPHLDLYHPLRRLHKGVYPDTKLQTMERELCGFQREDDLPGSLAPEAWFDFLGNRAHRLEGVFRHNLEDVLSLVTLAYWLENVQKREGLENLAAATGRELAIAKALHKAGRGSKAVERLSHHLGQTNTAEVWCLRAQIEERLERYTSAIESVEAGLSVESQSPVAVRMLALRSKLMEHKQKDWTQAMKDCRLGLSALADLRSFQGRPALERELKRRLERLENKRKANQKHE